MPNRILKDSICTSDDIAGLGWMTEVFWYRLIVQCDDYGRFDARPAIIRARCYPLALEKVGEADIQDMLEVLQARGMIRLYTVENHPYLQIASWGNHQQMRAAKSKYPPLQADDSNGYQAQSDSLVNRESLIVNRESLIVRDDDAVMADDSNLRAIRNAYDACGIMLSKSHLGAHLETIARTGLPAWQAGFAAALAAGKHNIVNYVTRCAESSMIAQQRGNGHGKSTTPQLPAADPTENDAAVQRLLDRLPAAERAEMLAQFAAEDAELAAGAV